MIYPRVSLYFTSFRGLTQKCREPIRRIFIRMEGNDQLLQVIFLTILQQKNKAVLAIQIRSPYVYFVETGSGTTEEYGEKPKVTTKYDLCSGIDSAICTGQGKPVGSTVIQCRFFTTRSTNEGRFVIRFDPDIVGKRNMPMV